MSAEVDVAWAAGLFEGEGTACLTGKGFAQVALCMSDGDVVQRFADVVGFGRVSGPHRPSSRNPKHKDRWIWQTGRRELVVELFELFRPYLGERRIAQFERALGLVSAGSS